METPMLVASAEEASLIWKWLSRRGVGIIRSTGTMTLPIHPIPALG
jgi:hypothetical protein